MADQQQERPDGVNVQVLLRCRPLSDREIVDRTPQVIVCSDAQREVTLLQNAGGKQMSRTFRFDRVFGPDSTQERLYKQAIVPIVNEVMDGFNCTIFAYGQTGTGKTWTMEGGPRQSTDGHKLSAAAGVIPRCIRHIYDTIESNNMDSAVKVSFLELYNEELTDLLYDEPSASAAAAASGGAASKALRLLEDRSGVVVQNLEEISVSSATEIYQVLDRGTAKRRTAATLLNNRSSRSHSIFSITIHLKETTPEGEDVVKIGKLNLVDLAGSENISRSGAKDSRAREAGSINQSLLTLGRVITALVEHSGHIPYRDSKLTRLLRDSLGGRTKTCIIATIAPTVQCSEETISTLDYAHRAKNIRNKPEVNQKISKTTLIKDMATEIEKLKTELLCTRDKNGVYIPADRYEQGEMERTQLKESVKNLKAELEEIGTEHEKELEVLNTDHEKEVDSLQNELDVKLKELAEAQDSLNEAVIIAQERQFVILSHQRAETALAAHANALTGELSCCAGDMGSLFSKLEEVATLQGADRDVMLTIKALVSERLRQLDASVAGAVQQQRQALGAVATDLGSFRTQKDTDVAQLRDQVSAMQASLAELHSNIKSQMAAGRDSFVSALGRTGDMTREYGTAAVAAADAAHATATQAVTALVSALEQQSTELRRMADQQVASSTEALTALNSMADGAKANFTGISGALSKLQVSNTARAARADGELAGFATQFGTAMQLEQDALVEQMGAAIKAFSLQRTAAVNAAVESLRRSMAEEAAAGASGAGEIEEGAKSAATTLTAHQASLCAQMEAQSRASSTAAQTVGATMQQAAASATAEQLPAIACAHQSQSKMVGSLAEGIAGLVDQGTSMAKSMTEGGLNAAHTGLQGVNLQATQLVESAFAQHADSVAMVDSMMSMGAEASVAISSFDASQQTLSSALCVAVGLQTDAQLGRVVDMGSAPARRVVPLPPPAAVEELVCPAEEVVLQQYRREKAQILMRGGDARHLLSPNQGGFVRDEASVQQQLAEDNRRVAEPQAQALVLAAVAQENSRPAGDLQAPTSKLPAPAPTTKSRIPTGPVHTVDSSEALVDMTNAMEE